MEGFTTSATMNVTGISTFRNDITITGSQAGVTSIFFDASTNTLQFQDLSYAKFGAGSDLSIYHDSENSYIDDSGTGNLTIRSSQINFDKYTGESLARFRSDGNCELFYNNVSRFKTADGGTITTGIATADGFSVGDNEKFVAGDGGDLEIFHNGSHSRISDAGVGKLQLGGSEVEILNAAFSESCAKFIADGAVELYHDSIKRLQTESDGIKITAGEGEEANITFFADEGDNASDKFRLRTSDSAGFFIENYQNGSSWESNIKVVGNGAVTLYHDDAAKLATSATGATVTGNLAATSLVGAAVTINNTGIDAGIGAGICTAKEFYGDGSNLTGIAAGGSGEFNTSISGATQYDVTTSMAVAFTANASSSHRTIVHSIHICNISAAEASISGEIQSSFSLAHTVPVPAGSAVELLKQPKVLGPSETIELQSDTASALEATIIIEYKEDTDYWDAAIDLTSAATLTDIYTSTTNPSVVQSILLANDSGSLDVKARVAWTDGSDNIQSYLVYDMIIPADSTVEICEKPKYLAAGYKLRGYANQADRLEITASGKQITS